ncbi:MAG: aspartate aminotransferase family protein [Candidatus Njordarchaeales archaeon]
MDYVEFSKKSKELYELAKKYLPGGVTYHIRAIEPYPFYVVRAKGSRVWDVDGNEYIDFWMAHGAAVLGHNYDAIINAVKDQLEYGIHFGWSNEWEIKWAEAVCRWFDMDKVRPSNSGTEANMYAIRLARAYTGRRKVGKFAGGWHGGYDGLHKAVAYPFDKPSSLGLTDCVQNDIVILPYNDLEGVYEKVKNEELAAIIIEPILGAGGAIPAERDFLKGLRELCDEKGIVLIFDEVITGFRFYKGAQHYYGVKPDIITTGKAVGGQYFPGAGAICGVEEIMDLIDHTKRKNFWERVFHGGTYTGNALTMRAGYTLIRELETKKDKIFPYLDSLGEKFRKKLEEIFQDYGVEALVTGLSSMIGIHFTKAKKLDPVEISKTKDFDAMKKLHRHMLNNKIVYLSPFTPHLFLSIAHTKDDVEQFLKQTEIFLKETKKSV